MHSISVLVATVALSVFQFSIAQAQTSGNAVRYQSPPERQGPMRPTPQQQADQRELMRENQDAEYKRQNSGLYKDPVATKQPPQSPPSSTQQQSTAPSSTASSPQQSSSQPTASSPSNQAQQNSSPYSPETANNSGYKQPASESMISGEARPGSAPSQGFDKRGFEVDQNGEYTGRTIKGSQADTGNPNDKNSEWSKNFDKKDSARTPAKEPETQAPSNEQSPQEASQNQAGNESKGEQPQSEDSKNAANESANEGTTPEEGAGANTNRVDGSGAAKSNLAAQMNSGVKQLTSLQTQGQVVGLMVRSLPKLNPAVGAYVSSQKTCTTDQSRASYVCREETSPNLQGTLMLVNGLIGAVQTAGVHDACSQATKTFDLVKAGLTTYTALCGGLRGKCGMSCAKSVKDVQAIQTALAAPAVCAPNPNPAASSHCANLASQVNQIQQRMASQIKAELVAEDKAAVAGKVKTCSVDYGNLLLSAGISMMSTIQNLQKSKNCESSTVASSMADPKKHLAELCSKAENKGLTECICYHNPRTMGCNNSLMKSAQVNASLGVQGAESGKPVAGAQRRDSSGYSYDSQLGGNSASGAGSSGRGVAGVVGASAAAGGGPGFSGSSAGLQGKSGGTAAESSKLPGAYSYETGDGSGGSSGISWGAEEFKDSSLSQYLPGGAQDPTAQAVSGDQAPGSGEISSSSGESNFEKIKNRYKFKRGSFADQ